MDSIINKTAIQNIIKEITGVDDADEAREKFLTTSKGVMSKARESAGETRGQVASAVSKSVEDALASVVGLTNSTISKRTLPEDQETPELPEDRLGESFDDTDLYVPEIKKEEPTDAESIDTSSDVTDSSTAPEVQSTYGKVGNPKQVLLNKIAFAEGATPEALLAQKDRGMSTNEYDMVYAYGEYVVPDKNVSEMTLKELYNYQVKLINATKGKVPGTELGTSAVGKYQILKKSLFGSGTPEKPMEDSWAEKLDLTPDTVFTPEIQEKIARLALKETGYDSFAVGKKTEEDFHNSIAKIWASITKVSGEDTYDQGASTSYSDLQSIYKLIKPKIAITNRQQ
tara:strand:- start:2014 stop:3039 length:1026 start_codon:yes stop_codon:yes gene_type:complete